MKTLLLALLVVAGLIAPQFLAAQTPDKKPAAKPAPKAAKPDPAMAVITDDPKLPRVLLIGDSISIGYTVPVREQLAGKANVHRILTNGGPTSNGVANLAKWLGTGKWDVIHFNWGLHDLKYMDTGKQQIPPDEMRKPPSAGRPTQSHRRETDLVQHHARARRQAESTAQTRRRARLQRHRPARDGGK